MVGQRLLSEFLDTVTITTCPHQILLVGNKGCGKTLFCNELGKKLEIPVTNITDNLSAELITELNAATSYHIYNIDLSSVPIKEMNILLKILEEPPIACIFVLECRALTAVLPTILSRCSTIFNFEQYTNDVLKQFIKDGFDETILRFVSTPGELLALQLGSTLSDGISLANLIFDKINIANYSNILTIPDKFAWQNEQNKIDFDIFVSILMTTVYDRIIAGDNTLYKQFQLTSELYTASTATNANKKLLFEKYLINLKEAYCGA